MDEVSIDVAAPPEKIWALLTDITQMGRWSPECTKCAWLDGAGGPKVGARFKGVNRHGLARWSTKSVVTKADAPAVFEWQVEESGMKWGYRFDALPDGGTTVTEYRDKTRDIKAYVKLVQKSGLLGRNREALMIEGMHTTLARVKAAAES